MVCVIRPAHVDQPVLIAIDQRKSPIETKLTALEHTPFTVRRATATNTEPTIRSTDDACYCVLRRLFAPSTTIVSTTPTAGNWCVVSQSSNYWSCLIGPSYRPVTVFIIIFTQSRKNSETLWGSDQDFTSRSTNDVFVFFVRLFFFAFLLFLPAFWWIKVNI